jgi:hypothetical protein
VLERERERESGVRDASGVCGGGKSNFLLLLHSGRGKEPQKFVLNAQLGNCCLCSPRVAAAFTLGPAFMIGLSALGANLGRKMFNARRFDRQ